MEISESNQTNISKIDTNYLNLKGNRIIYLPQTGNNAKTIFQNSDQVIQVRPPLSTSIIPGKIVYKQGTNCHFQNLTPDSLGTLTKSGINPQRLNTDQKTIFISNQPFLNSTNATYVYAIPTSNIAKTSQASLTSNTQNLPHQGVSGNGQVVHAPVASLMLQSSNQTGIKNFGTLRTQNGNLNRPVIPYILNSNGQPAFLSISQLNQINLNKQNRIQNEVQETVNASIPKLTTIKAHTSCNSSSCNNQSQIQCTCQHKNEQCSEDTCVSSTEEASIKKDKEEDEDEQVPQSHVNYLMKLFQALANSGVKSESFITAFKNLGMSLDESTNESIKEKLSSSLQDLESMKGEISVLRTYHKSAAQDFEKNMKILNFKLMNRMRQVQTAARNKVMCPLLEPQIQQVRADRLRLDRITSDFNGKKMNTVGQLSDLEGVLEEIVDEMLKGRCALNSNFVNSLELRLLHATNSILLCTERLPSLVQMQSRQVEIESSANDYEKQNIDRQMKQLEELKEKCKKLSETINTFKKLVDMQSSGGLSERKERRLNNVKSYFMNRKDSIRFDRSKILKRIDLLQPDSQERMRKIELQEALLKRRRRVLLDVPSLTNYELNKTKSFLASSTKIVVATQNANFSNGDVSAESHSSEDENDLEEKKNEKSENNFLKAAMNASMKIGVIPILKRTISNQSNANNKKKNHVMFSTKVHCNIEDQDLKLNCILANNENLKMEKIPTFFCNEDGF